jgi:hypothetical protein
VSQTYDDVAHVTLTKSRHVIAHGGLDSNRVWRNRNRWRRFRITNHMMWLCGRASIRRWTGICNSVMSECQEVGRYFSLDDALRRVLTEADKDGGSAGLVRQWNLSNKPKKT